MQKEIKWLLDEKYKGIIPKGAGQKQFKKDVKRLNSGEPLDYIIGFKQFLGCKIDLSKKPLIPRPETEYWAGFALEEVKKALAFKKSSEDVKSTVKKSWGHENYNLKILDIFAGSGCIGTAMLANSGNLLPACRKAGVTVDFADKEKKCLNQIKINLKNNFIKPGSCKVLKSDIFSKVRGKYDFIFANPPYIATKFKNKVQKSVLKYEPKTALFGGKDGMVFIKKFFKKAKKHLNPGGKIYMELSPEQKKQIESLLCDIKHYKKWQFNKDQFGKIRWVVIE